MVTLVGILIVVCVATVIAQPLLRPSTEASSLPGGAGEELWRREKAVALTAIKEAEFDHATGKLTDEDYAVLREGYEERAAQAMGELDRLAESLAKGAGKKADTAGSRSATASFCTACGSKFEGDDRFCAGCGEARG